MAGMAQRIKGVADGLGLPLNPSGMIYNTRLAQEMAKWAEFKGKGDEVHQALFRAYFVDGRNIGQLGEVVKIAVDLGLPEDEAREAIEGGRFKGAVDADWDRALALGIRAVPTFVMEGERLVGFQSYEALERFAASNGAVRRGNDKGT